ncbi:MAG: EAL domain-containing protein [Cyanobacteria bacterium J06648_16]
MLSFQSLKLATRFRFVKRAYLGWRRGCDRSLALFRSFPYAVIGSAIALIVYLALQLGLLESLELGIYDYWVRQQAQRSAQIAQVKPLAEGLPNILIVGVTEADIRAQAKWPMTDQVMAEVIDRLQQQRPRAIGLDIYRDIAYPPGEAALGEQLRADNLFAIESLIDGVPAPPSLPLDRVGFNDLIVDPDGVVRRNLFYTTLAGEGVYSLSLRIALYLMGQSVTAETQTAVWLGDIPIPALAADAGGYHQADNIGYQTLLQYAPTDFRQVSLTEVLEGQVDPTWIRDSVIMIGTVAPSAKDIFFTPFSVARTDQPTTPGVVIHAHYLRQLLAFMQGEQPPMGWWSSWQELLWILVWSLTGGWIAWRYRRPLLLLGLAGLSLVGLTVLCGWAFSASRWLLLATPTLSLLLSLLLVAVYKVFYYSFYDPLTGLPNRALLLRHLQPLLQERHRKDVEISSAIAILFVDIDGFKSINESIGQEGGNRVLCRVAQRLKQSLPGVMVARVGGDEFAVLLASVDYSWQATQAATRLQNDLASPEPKATPSVVTASIGIALHQAGYRYRAADLLQDAHRATYRARQLGKARYEVFAWGMRTQAISQFQLEMDLRQAITEQTFELYYQPIVCLKSGHISGFEALLRWLHPERGFVSPGDFIPVAEETGLIIPLGRWILETACRQMHQWNQQFPQEPPLFMSVNLSGRQFNQTDLVEQIEQALALTQLDRRSLKLELTESIAMENVTTAIDQLLRLKKMGLQISLDDFGTGYSSLSYLHRFSTDTLKVDRSFVSRMEQATEDGEIVSTIIALGHKLGMTVVAEGIETPSHLQQLRSLRCDYGQGYLFAKPLSAQQAVEWLQQPRRW